MLKKRLLFVFVLPTLLFGDLQYSVENTNITLLSDENSGNYNYDRLRFRSDYTYGNVFATFIGDGVNYFGESYINSDTFTYIKEIDSDTPFKTQTEFKEYNRGSAYAKVYRAYAGYEDGKNRVVLGLQNITMGVGRIWTPTNLYNPKNSYGLESAEVFGVGALLYTRYLDDTSHASVVVSQSADNVFEYGLRYKTFLDFADFALDIVSSESMSMIGYEVEANLADTGVELRSEGTYIQSTLSALNGSSEDVDFFQGIVGADYGFENGLNVVLESLYTSKTFSHDVMIENFDTKVFSNMYSSNFYVGGSVSFILNIYLDASLLYIQSMNKEESRFIYPTLNYTFNDYNTFSIGLIHKNTEKNSYFLKYLFSF